ncbi:MAG: type VI secretion system baseplate subunit TssG [Chitinispirillaceae bacterium]|nr:type VI secretion system baseplate subunit TssG [Chitinispirillaceae bacterium]
MASLSERLQQEYHQFNFFQAVSLIEEYFQSQGERNPIDTGKIRFVPDPSISFPPNDIAGIRDIQGVYVLMLSFMGLVGITSPLPVYFSEYLSRRQEHAPPLYNFLTIFNHRIHTLFYKSWKKYHFIKAFSTDGSDLFSRNIGRLTGCTSETQSPEQLRLLAYCGILAGLRRGPAALEALLSDYFGNIPVRIEQFFPRWTPLREKTKLGIDSRLGMTALCGTSFYDVAGKFRVVVGPLKREIYEEYLCGSDNIGIMKSIIRDYIADPLDFDIEVQLQSMELIPVRLGWDTSRLGTTSSLGKSSSRSEIESVIIE